MGGYERLVAVYLDSNSNSGSGGNESAQMQVQAEVSGSSITDLTSVDPTTINTTGAFTTATATTVTHVERLQSLVSDPSFQATIDADNIQHLSLLTTSLPRHKILHMLHSYISLTVDEMAWKLNGVGVSGSPSPSQCQEIHSHIAALVQMGEIQYASCDQTTSSSSSSTSSSSHGGSYIFDEHHCRTYMSDKGTGTGDDDSNSMDISGTDTPDTPSEPVTSNSQSQSESQPQSRLVAFNGLRVEMNHSTSLAAHLHTLHNHVTTSEAYIYQSNKTHFQGHGSGHGSHGGMGMGMGMGVMDMGGMGESMDMHMHSGIRSGVGSGSGAGGSNNNASLMSMF